MPKGYFALRLRKLRDAAGLSQAGLSERTGVSVSALRQFEQGRREPTYGSLIKLAEGMGLSLAAFDSGQEVADDNAPTPHPGRPRQDAARGQKK